MSIPKYHHLIPRTYLRAWSYSNESIYVMNKETKLIESKNINNNFGITQFHSITAGMPICEYHDLVKIFKPLENYEVFYDNKLIDSLEEYNNSYFQFDKWIIKKEGIEISQKNKNILKSEIDKVKIIDIESLWEKKYENKWKWLCETIENKVLKTDLLEIDEFYKGLIMKFAIAYNWRGFYGNDSFNLVYNWISNLTELREIKIATKDRQKKYLETASQEMQHFLLLKNYRKFLRDDGIMYELAKNYIRLMGIKFYVTVGNSKFMTSDNPSFVGKNIDGKLLHILPVSPNIIACIGLNSKHEKKYFIERISDREVFKINKQIVENSVERVITINNKIEL